MIEKNHSQRNIYLHDLKNNNPNQQPTVSVSNSGNLAWLALLVVVTILVVVTHLSNSQKINTDKTLANTDNAITFQNNDGPYAYRSTDSTSSELNKNKSDDVAGYDSNATLTDQASKYSSRHTNYPGSAIEFNNEVNNDVNFGPLAVQSETISLASETGPQRDLIKITSKAATIEPITDARYYPEQPDYNWITIKIKKGDSLSKIFDRLGLSHKDAIELASVNNMKSLNYLNVGQKLEIKTTLDNEFAGLKYNINRIKTIEVNKDSKGEIVSTIEELEPQIRIRDVTAPIDGNLFSTADNLKIPNRIISKLSTIFRWDIDFARDIKEGDRFSLIFEEQYINDELIVTGDILAAEFIINGDITRAIRHKDENGNSHYYTPEGKSLRKAFMRNPIKFAKITSGFTKRRYHPVLKKWRAHKGVDYGAPKGTPIMATADGLISHIGRKGAYGKAIVISHGKSYSSLYGHMKGFRKGLKNGSRVKQGQIIGYVGSTGLATGPHLHYEFRIDGKHVDPLAVDLPKSLPIASDELNEFIAASEKWIRRLDALQGQPIATVESNSQPSI